MEKTYKRMPFDIELAKKIQSGEIEGRIVTNNGYAVRIICFDKRTSSGYPILGLVDYPNMSEVCKAFNVYGVCYDQPVEYVEYVLQIELPDETPKYDDAEEVPIGDGSIVFLRHKKHEFKPFDKVLVRQNGFDKWKANFFSHMDDGYYKCVNSRYKECVLFKGNEHLVGTTDKPKED